MPTQKLLALHREFPLWQIAGPVRCSGTLAFRYSIVDPLVPAMDVEEAAVDPQRPLQTAPAEENEVVQAFLRDAAYPSFCMSIGIWGAEGR